MYDDKMKRAKDTLKSLVKKIQPGSTFSIISLGQIVKIHTRLDWINQKNGIFEKSVWSEATILKEIDKFDATMGFSDLEKALKLTTEVIKKSDDTVKRIFLISDGMNFKYFNDTLIDKYASKLKMSVIEIGQSSIPSGILEKKDSLLYRLSNGLLYSETEVDEAFRQATQLTPNEQCVMEKKKSWKMNDDMVERFPESSCDETE